LYKTTITSSKHGHKHLPHPVVGSSKTTTAGEPSRDMAIDSLLLMPPDKATASCPCTSGKPSPTASAIDLAAKLTLSPGNPLIVILSILNHVRAGIAQQRNKQTADHFAFLVNCFKLLFFFGFRIILHFTSLHRAPEATEQMDDCMLQSKNRPTRKCQN
jgi:hypothetical protein